MRRTLVFLPAALLVFASACKDKVATNVTIDPDDGAEDPGRGPDDHAARGPRPPVDKIQLHGSASGIGEMLTAGNLLLATWNPPEPGSAPIDLRTMASMMLIQNGFGPGFFDSLKLDELHAFEFAYPIDGQPGTGSADVELVVALTASDPVRAIESLPATMAPQPLGNNLWRTSADDLDIYLRASADAVELALAMDQLERASGLRQKIPAGPRIRWGASNIPPGDMDIGELVPVPVLGDVLNETTAAEFSGDFGSDRDFSARLDVRAPFDRLGLDPIGPATQQPSDLARLLPGDAMGVWVMPWGNPRLLHGVLDREIPVSQIPAPFDSYVGDVLRGAHSVLDQVRDEVLVAAYLDGKQQLTFVFAAEIGEEAAARTALRSIWIAAEKAFGDHIALVGSAPEHKYKVSFKTDSVKVGKAKADAFTVTLSKALADDDDLAVFDSLVGRKAPKLEVLLLITEGKVFVTVGAGGREILAALGRNLAKPNPSDSLEGDGGLARARTLTDGCQYCVAIDPLEVVRLVLTIQADDPDAPDSARKLAREGSKAIAKLGVADDVALALRLESDRGSFGISVPKSVLFLDRTKAAKVVSLFKAIDDAQTKAFESGAEAKPAATTKPPAKSR